MKSDSFFDFFHFSTISALKSALLKLGVNSRMIIIFLNRTNKIKKYAMKLGADVVGIADLALLEGIETQPPDLLDGYSRAICVGRRFDEGIMEMIRDRPTPAYATIHKALNEHLDMINEHLVEYISEQGYKARRIPATEAGKIAEKMTHDFFKSVDFDTFDWKPLTSASLPSKAVARAAGLGWFGKNLLIINPKLGPSFRHASLITDMPLKPDKPLERQKCGKCNLCKEACPSQAIKGLNFDGIPPGREVVLDNFEKCRSLLWLKHRNLRNVGYPICGICIRSCPWSRKSLKHKIGRTLFGKVPPNILTSLPEFIWK